MLQFFDALIKTKKFATLQAFDENSIIEIFGIWYQDLKKNLTLSRECVYGHWDTNCETCKLALNEKENVIFTAIFSIPQYALSLRFSP